MPDGIPERDERIDYAPQFDEDDVVAIRLDAEASADSQVVPEDDEADLLRIQRLYSTTDAMVWATEWCIVARKLEYLGKPLIDEGWMVGWFANAIEIGREAGYRKAMESIDTDDGRGTEFTR